MAETIEGVRPTRMELLRLRKRVILAQRGHRLLKEKRDALISEFIGVVREVRRARRKVEAHLEKAYRALTTTQIVLGVSAVDGISAITGQRVAVELRTRSIMGVAVPRLSVGRVERKVTERGYGFGDTSAALDEAAAKFEECLTLITELAEIEETVRRIGLEVEKTKRRVNALEYIVIPRLKATVKYIQMRLDEMARDSFLRLKRVKAALESRGG
jgi:V/A-type H+-transporting ATPase subunit D